MSETESSTPSFSLPSFSGIKKHSRRKSSLLISILLSIKNFFQRRIDLSSVDGGDELDNSNVEDPGLSANSVAWLHACYNAMVFVIVFIVGSVLLCVYYVLEPFLRPLLWAILIGMVLHPFKHTSTSGISHWLRYIQKSGIPLTLGAIFTPLFLFNWLLQMLEDMVTKIWKIVAGLVLGVFVLLFIYMLQFHVLIYRCLEVMVHVVESMGTLIFAPLYLTVFSVLISFVALLLLTRRWSKKDTPSIAFRVLSSVLWYILILNISAYFLGSMAIPLVSSLFLVAAILGVFWKKKKKEKKAEEEEIESLHYLEPLKVISNLVNQEEEETEVSTLIDIRSASNVATDDLVHGSSSVDPPSDAAVAKNVGRDPMELVSSKESSLKTRKSPGRMQGNAYPVPGGSGGGGAGAATAGTSGSVGDGFGDVVKLKSASAVSLASSLPEETKEIPSREGGQQPLYKTSQIKKKMAQQHNTNEQSSTILVVLSTACLVVFFWKYPLFLILLSPLFLFWKYPLFLFLLSPLILWVMLRHILSANSVFGSGRLKSTLSGIMAYLTRGQQWVIFPPPLPTIVRMLVYVDHLVLGLVVKSMGSLVTLVIILGLVVAVGVVFVVLLFEIQAELTHYVTVGGAVWNKTLTSSPELAELIYGAVGKDTWSFNFENLAQQIYGYCRAWLTQKVHAMLSDSSNTDLLEKQILGFFDVVYGYHHAYFLPGSPTVTIPEDILKDTLPSKDALFTQLKNLVLDNLETIPSVLHSLGTIITTNISLALSLVYTLIQLLFSGGTVLINMIVFMSALFYLLSFSEERYLPVQWVTDLLPHSNMTSGGTEEERASPDQLGGGGEGERRRQDWGEAFQRAIRSVFHASFRRAFFYGLYTWLTHTIVNIPVSILPSVLAALAGAIPFVGPYWVSMPAILELWLVDGALLAALVLCILTLLPPLFIDTLINEEIEGGHPYLTGLAIAGGIYFAGLEGALIGPILLCCLLFFMNVYEDMLSV